MPLFRNMRKPRTKPTYDTGMLYLHAAVSYLYANCCGDVKPFETKDQMFSSIESVYREKLLTKNDILAAVKIALSSEKLARFSSVNILDAHEFANNITHDCIGYDCD